MRSDSSSRAPRALSLAAIAGLLFLHVPLLIIFLYAFTTEEKSYQFPPPGFTLKWFSVVWERQDIWDAIGLSLKVAAIATAKDFRLHPHLLTVTVARPSDVRVQPHAHRQVGVFQIGFQFQPSVCTLWQIAADSGHFRAALQSDRMTGAVHEPNHCAPFIPGDFHARKVIVLLQPRKHQGVIGWRTRDLAQDQTVYRDPLTGAANRRGIDLILEAASKDVLLRAPSYGLILLDIDFFKQINDTHGHLAGDRILQLVATTLRKNIRPVDEVGRWGGDELLVVLRQVDAAELAVSAETLRSLVASSHTLIEEEILQRRREVQVVQDPVSIPHGSRRVHRSAVESALEFLNGDLFGIERQPHRQAIRHHARIP